MAHTTRKEAYQRKAAFDDQRASIVPIILFCGLGLLLPLLWFQITLDDAYISFRYARNLYEGYGFGIWNPGEPAVEGMSSTMWILLLALLRVTHLSYFAAAKVTGFLSLLSLPLVCVYAYSQRRRVEEGEPSYMTNAYLVAAVLFCLYLPLSWYAVSGMETIFFASQVLSLITLDSLGLTLRVNFWLTMLLSLTLVLTRPEGLLLGLMIAVFRGVALKQPRPAFTGGLTTLLSFALLSVFRLKHFGELLPNTYYAKGAGGGINHIFLGTTYVLRFFEFACPMVIFLIVTSWVRRHRFLRDPRALGLFTIMFIYTLYVIKVGGDPASAFPMFRHFVHTAPIWILLLALACAHLQRQVSYAIMIGAVILTLTSASLLVSAREFTITAPLTEFHEHGMLHLKPEAPSFVWLSRLTDSDTISAAALAGQWGYYVPGKTIDMLGLNDRYVAHHGTRRLHTKFVDSKTDMDYVLNRHPDIIDGFMSASALNAHVCPEEITSDRQNILHKMLANPIFKSDYVFVNSVPYGDYNRAIFFKKDFAQKHADQGLRTEDVAETVLYANPDCSRAGQEKPASPIF